MRPPERWPNAATRCSRPPSRRCAGSACARGGSARSPPPPSSCSTRNTPAPHDQQVPHAVTGNGSMGTPRQVFRTLPRAVAKFSTTSTMEVLDAGATSATIRYALHAGYVHSRLDCIYAQGLFSVVPTIFGLPEARIRHDECESDGHPACIYEVTWDRRSRLPRRRRETAGTDAELNALRGQLRILQSAATDLVGSDDVDTALDRIIARAAEAVLA